MQHKAAFLVAFSVIFKRFHPVREEWLDASTFLVFSLYLSSLRPLDIEFMRRLSKVVNIVPVIAKADTLTLEERDYFKQRVRE